MEMIYHNFDGLDITFQGIVPEKILNQLKAIKEQAQDEKRDIPMKLGKTGKMVMVAESGMGGGYRYRFSTGPDGETWAFMHSTNSQVWGIRISVNSMALAQHGYEGVKKRILDRLTELEAIGPSRLDEEGGITNFPLERISRFDYCFDFVMDGSFNPNPEHFIAHHRATKHVYDERGSIVDGYRALSGDRVNTIRIGGIKNRQVVLYNKSIEIRAKSKHHWWQYWSIEDRTPFIERLKQVWRIEVRAGGEEIKKWEARRFKDFEKKIGDIIPTLLKAYRYTVPLKNNLKRSSWPMHPIWQYALKTSLKELDAYSSNAIRENVIKQKREDIEQGNIDRAISGIIGLNAIRERDFSELPETINNIKTYLKEMADKNSQILIRKHDKKRGDYLVIR